VGLVPRSHVPSINTVVRVPPTSMFAWMLSAAIESRSPAISMSTLSASVPMSLVPPGSWKPTRMPLQLPPMSMLPSSFPPHSILLTSPGPSEVSELRMLPSTSITNILSAVIPPSATPRFPSVPSVFLSMSIELRTRSKKGLSVAPPSRSSRNTRYKSVIRRVGDDTTKRLTSPP